MARKNQGIAPKERPLDLQFPFAGVDLSGSYGAQRKNTTPIGTNVRAIDPASGRLRGGQRPGIMKHINSTINSTNNVQNLEIVTSTGYVSGGTSFIPGSANIDLQGRICVGVLGETKVAGIWNAGQFVAFAGFTGDTIFLSVTQESEEFIIVSADSSNNVHIQRTSNSGVLIWNQGTVTTLNGVRSATSHVSGTILYVNIPGRGIYRFNHATGTATSTNPWVSSAAILAATGYYATGGPIWIGSVGLIGLHSSLSDPYNAGYALIDTSGNITSFETNLLGGAYATADTPFMVGANIGASKYYLVLGGYNGTGRTLVQQRTTAMAIDWSSGPWELSAGGGFLLYSGVGGSGVVVVLSGPRLSLSLSTTDGSIAGAGLGTNLTNFADIGGGLIFLAGKSDGFRQTDGIATIWGIPTAKVASSPGDMTATNHTGSGVDVVNTGSGVLVGGAAGTYNRAVSLVGVAGGTVKVAYAGAWRAVTNGSGALSATAPVIRSAENQGKIYYVDGTNAKYYDPALNSVETWSATSGALPTDSAGNRPRLICTWRGRTVLSGLPLDGQNWFMSAVNAPANWNYSPTSTSPTQAIAGNNAPQGYVGDIITGLAPYSDDVLIFFCDHTIWMMRGDPLAGGQIDRISDTIGGAWGTAWCKGPDGALYFVSNRMGIYRLVPGEQPQHISQQIEQMLLEIKGDSSSIRLIWDEPSRGLHVFVTSTTRAQAERHYFWEAANNAWWTEVFGDNSFNPLCCVTFDGDLPSDRIALIGCWDGYVRSFQQWAPDDDGTDIDSEVVFGCIATSNLDEMMLTEMQGVLGVESGIVAAEVLVGDTPERALRSNASYSTNWLPGRNLTDYVRRSGHAIWIRVTASLPWSMEIIRTMVSERGWTRRRGA